VHSGVLPGFWLRPAWLWQEPLPDPLPLFFEMRGLPPDVLQGEQAARTTERGTDDAETA
jgi:hypothetical protein